MVSEKILQQVAVASNDSMGDVANIIYISGLHRNLNVYAKHIPFDPRAYHHKQ
jgi:hypothetical protein